MYFLWRVSSGGSQGMWTGLSLTWSWQVLCNPSCMMTMPLGPPSLLPPSPAEISGGVKLRTFNTEEGMRWHPVGFSSCFLSGSLAHCILSHHPLAAALRTSYMDSLGQRDFPKKWFSFYHYLQVSSVPSTPWVTVGGPREAKDPVWSSPKGQFN